MNPTWLNLELIRAALVFPPSIASPLLNRSSLEPNCRLEVRSGATARLRRDGADGRPWDGCSPTGTP